MARPLQQQSIRQFGIYGLIRQAELDDYLMPEGTVTEVSNFHFDRKGTGKLRLGLAALGGTISTTNACLGLFNVQSATLVAGFISSGSMRISEYSGSAWNTLYTGTGGSTQLRAVDFAGRTIFISGLERSAVAWNGSGLDSVNATIENSGNPINLNQWWYARADSNTGYLRPKYIEVYKSRIYIAGDSVNPDRIYFSSVITSGGNVTWAPATDFVDINPNDGENVTALKRYSLKLLVFKPNYIYQFSTSGLDPDPLIKVGTSSQESVVEGKRGVYFHHPSGIYRYSGGYPVEISRPISDFIDNIAYANYSTVNSWRDQDHIYFNVGNVTVPETLANVTYTNCVLRYTESSDIWTIYTYANPLVRGADFNSGSALTRVVGTGSGTGGSSGLVATFNSGNTDIAEPISYRCITKWYEWEGFSNQKTIEQLVAITEFAEEALLFYMIDDDQNWTELGQLSDFFTRFSHVSIDFNRIRFKIAGVSSQTGPIFRGIEISKGLESGVIR